MSKFLRIFVVGSTGIHTEMVKHKRRQYDEQLTDSGKFYFCLNKKDHCKIFSIHHPSCDVKIWQESDD